jgi:hypothetical protein
VRFQFFFRGVIICGGGESAEAFIAGHRAQTVVPFAYLSVIIGDLPMNVRRDEVMRP